MSQINQCKHTNKVFSKSCGAYICQDCNNHEGLTRCYCGWSEFGENGEDELWEMGENIEETGDFF